MPSRMSALLNSRFILTTALFSALAFAITLLCRDHDVKPAVPVAFLLALVPVFLIAGRMASLLVAIIASLIFAAFLYEPYGSLAIHNGVEDRTRTRGATHDSNEGTKRLQKHPIFRTA